MLRKIILENFMSHGRTEIDLADGLTVLTGPNNCGKSAVVAALQILATNGRTTHVTRHGAKVCRVTVETDDGHVIVWERKGTTVKYTLDGEDVHRVGASTPDRLHDLLRLDRVESDMGKSKYDYDIHFGEQKQPVFLLGETGSRAASFFASSSDASRLVEMQHRHRSNVADRKKDQKRLAAESDKNELRLKALAPLDAIALSVAKAERLAEQIESNDRQIQTLQRLVKKLAISIAGKDRLRRQEKALQRMDQTPTTPQSLQSAADRHRALKHLIETISGLTRSARLLKRHSNLLRDLRPVPELLPADRCRSMITEAKKLAKRVSCARSTGSILSKLAQPPQFRDVQRLASLRKEIALWTANQATANQSIGIYERLTDPPIISTTDRMESTIRDLRGTSDRVARLQMTAQNFARLRPADEPAATTPLTNIIQRIGLMEAEVAAARKSVVEATKMRDQCESELREFVADNPTCQTCGGSIDPETLLSSGPTGHQHGSNGTTSRSTADRPGGVDV